MVHINPDTDAGMFQFIEKCRGWIADNNADLVIKKRANKVPLTTAPASRLLLGGRRAAELRR
jgi:hypothetical protein